MEWRLIFLCILCKYLLYCKISLIYITGIRISSLFVHMNISICTKLPIFCSIWARFSYIWAIKAWCIKYETQQKMVYILHGSLAEQWTQIGCNRNNFSVYHWNKCVQSSKSVKFSVADGFREQMSISHSFCVHSLHRDSESLLTVTRSCVCRSVISVFSVIISWLLFIPSLSFRSCCNNDISQ